MENFAVHMFTQVRVKVVGIKGESKTAALRNARDITESSMHFMLDRDANEDFGLGVKVKAIEWAEGDPRLYLVDVLDDAGNLIGAESEFFDSEGVPLVDGKTKDEALAIRAEKALTFFVELLGSVESLTAISDLYGPRTLSDLMYLQNAILSGGFVDAYPGESKVLDVVQSLPSGKLWAEYIKVEYMMSPSAPEEHNCKPCGRELNHDQKIHCDSDDCPRHDKLVLVTSTDGHHSFACDDGVEVVIVDLDDDREGAFEDRKILPARFAHLAAKFDYKFLISEK